jgi:hypothetical protein
MHINEELFGEQTSKWFYKIWNWLESINSGVDEVGKKSTKGPVGWGEKKNKKQQKVQPLIYHTRVFKLMGVIKKMNLCNYNCNTWKWNDLQYWN